MSFKNTAKRVKTLQTLNTHLGSNPYRSSSEALYQTLEEKGFWWDSETQEWVKGRPPSTSMFQDDQGDPSGVLRVRLMGMPPDAEAFSKALKVKGWTLIDKSRDYPNRKGPGSRWYLTYKRD